MKSLLPYSYSYLPYSALLLKCIILRWFVSQVFAFLMFGIRMYAHAHARMQTPTHTPNLQTKNTVFVMLRACHTPRVYKNSYVVYSITLI